MSMAARIAYESTHEMSLRAGRSFESQSAGSHLQVRDGTRRPMKAISSPADYGRTATPDWRKTDWMEFERDLVIAGRRVHYADVGAGDRCFLLVHGMGGRWQHWLETIPTLAEYGRVLAVDLPGFGASERAARAVSLQDFADVTAELALRLGEARVVAIGHSMGGQIALRLADQYRELTAGLVLVGGAIYQFRSSLNLRDELRLLLRRPMEALACVAELSTAGVRVPSWLGRRIVDSPRLRQLLLSPYFLEPSALPDDAVRLVVEGAGAPGTRDAVRALAVANLRQPIDPISCPVLSLTTRGDRIVPLADAEAFQADLPGTRTVVLDGCGHMPMLERPQAFNSELVQFIEGLV